MSTVLSMRGFAALLPVLITGTVLLSITAIASEDAFSLRRTVLHAENRAAAAGLARACAASVVLRLARDPGISIAPAEVQLADARCRIDHVVQLTDRYRIYTSAEYGSARSTWLIDAYLESGSVGHVISREI